MDNIEYILQVTALHDYDYQDPVWKNENTAKYNGNGFKYLHDSAYPRCKHYYENICKERNKKEEIIGYKYRIVKQEVIVDLN